VTGTERKRLSARGSVEPEVYESYLKGRFAYNSGKDRAAIESSIGYFNDAIRLDPSFAPAYVGLAAAGTVAKGVSPDLTRPQAVAAARMALKLDPSLGEAHALLANVFQEQWRWDDAEAEYRRALELSPNDASTHAGFALWLLCEGRTDQAVEWLQRGRQLDPLAVSGASVAWILYQSHRFEESIRELRSVLAVQPDDPRALNSMGFALSGDGRSTEAIPFLQKSISVSAGNAAAIGVLIRAYALAGRRSDALKLLEELQRRGGVGYVPAAAFVNAYLGLGDTQAAFDWLERAYQEQLNILQFLRVHPFFDLVQRVFAKRELRGVDTVNARP
jgi:pentatricopeptide repeat protein